MPSKDKIGSKRHRANLGLMPKGEVTAPEAVATLKKFKGPKFDQTINVVMHLGIDPAQADQAMRGSISLPKGIGKSKRVIAFCQSDKVADAMAAGAVKAGGEDLVQEIEKGSGVPNKEKVGKITKAQVQKIAKEKMADLNATTVEGAMRIVEGQARSMGVTVEG